MDLPIICTLTESELRERRETILNSLRSDALEVVAMSNGYSYRFSPGADILSKLSKLVELESQCCQFLTFKIIVAPNCLVKSGQSPVCDSIWIGAVFEQEFDPRVIVPVTFSEEHRGKAVPGGSSDAHEDLQCPIITTLRRVVCHLAVVWIGATLQQQLREFGMVRNSGSPVENAFEFRIRLVIVFKKSCFGTRARVQERGCG